MSVDEGLIAWVTEALEPIGPVTLRKMMGGATLYCGGTIFALIAGDSLCNRASSAYIGVMPIFPRPSTPKAAFGDLFAYLMERRRYKGLIFGLSAAVTFVVIFGFYHDMARFDKPEPTITWVNNIAPTQTDVDIIRQQMVDIEKRKRDLATVRQRFQKIADMSGVEWREDEKRNAIQRAKDEAEVEVMLQARLKKAQDALAAKGGQPEIGQSSSAAATP